MTRKTQRILRKYFPYAAVLLIACMVLGGILIFTRPEPESTPETQESEVPSSADPSSSDTSEEPTSESTTESETDSPDISEITEDSTESESESSEYPTVPAIDQFGIDALIDRYYQARIHDDAEELNKIVDSDTEYNTADLINETKFIHSYDHFSTYIIPGLTDDYFIAYVKYDIYFNGINTGAPALNHYVVRKDEDGYFCIVDRTLSGEFETYLEETENSETVRKLRSQVNIDLQKACDEDPDLAYLIRLLNGNLDEEEQE